MAKYNGAMSDVGVELDGATHVATIEIRRGPNNYFDIDVLAQLADEMHGVAERGARAIVLCSEGKHFCAGADFSGAAGRVGRDGGTPPLRRRHPLFEQPLPIVAAVQGAAIGGGLGLALAADFRVATPESRFAANFSQLGFHPGFGLTRHPPARRRAAGRRSTCSTPAAASTARPRTRSGCATTSSRGDELRGRAAELAAEIAAAAPLAVRSIRQTMRGSLVDEVRAAMAHERPSRSASSRPTTSARASRPSPSGAPPASPAE